MTPNEQYDACIELHRAGNDDGYLESLKKLVADHPDYALAYNALAAFYKKKGELETALDYAEKYCEFAPDDPFGYTILSSYHIEAGNREAAEEALGRAFDLRFKTQHNA